MFWFLNIGVGHVSFVVYIDFINPSFCRYLVVAAIMLLALVFVIGALQVC